MGEDWDTGQYEDQPDTYHERRRYERRAGADRRGDLRWDPRADEKERRSGNDRRRPNGSAYTRQ
jgi:hypothetical protein